MNILMMTNTYIPHVGGVARSVGAFTKELRRLGHRVVVVAPRYEEAQEAEADVIRIPAIQHFNGSDFSVVLPIPVFLESRLEDFKPDLVHSHHPFFMGSTAVRVSKKYNVPLVYTHHTMFEEYTHYVPIEFPKLKTFVVSLATGYANMSDQVIAPSDSAARILKERGVQTTMAIVPTGIDVGKFEHGYGGKIRASVGIGADAFVVGHVGRLSPEKNPDFLSGAVASFLQKEAAAHFLVVGYGPSRQQMEEFFAERKLSKRVHFLGKLGEEQLGDAYHAMDAFVFASRTETQGLVLVEAMCAGVPVVALDAPGVREVVRDGVNGYSLSAQRQEQFAEALQKLCHLPAEAQSSFSAEARRTGRLYSIKDCTSKLLAVYATLHKRRTGQMRDESMWQRSVEQLKTEWELLSNLTGAVGEAMHKHCD